jgi:hypothetical protein
MANERNFSHLRTLLCTRKVPDMSVHAYTYSVFNEHLNIGKRDFSKSNFKKDFEKKMPKILRKFLCIFQLHLNLVIHTTNSILIYVSILEHSNCTAEVKKCPHVQY